VPCSGDDDVITDGADELVILVELEQLRCSGGVALKGEQVSFRVDGNRRNTAAARGQGKRVSVCETHIRCMQFVRNDVALSSPGAKGRMRACVRAADTLNATAPPVASSAGLGW
jgi:hypothetical protein